jgi:hypothetical protein
MYLILMYFRLIDVLPILWCTSACLMYLILMYFSLFDVLNIDVLSLDWGTSDFIMYFSLFDVLQLVWSTLAYSKSCRVTLNQKIDIIILIQTHQERFYRRFKLEAKTVLYRKWNKILPTELQFSVGWPHRNGRRIVWEMETGPGLHSFGFFFLLINHNLYSLKRRWQYWRQVTFLRYTRHLK